MISDLPLGFGYSVTWLKDLLYEKVYRKYHKRNGMQKCTSATGDTLTPVDLKFPLMLG